MKRILMLNYEFPPLGGGAGNATYYLLKEFSKFKDLKIDLVTSSVDRFRVENFSDNIKIHYLDIGKKGNLHYQSKKSLLIYSQKAYGYSKQLIKKNNFDLIHAFFGIPCGYIAMKLKKKFNIPYIVSLRGSDVPFYNKRFYFLDKFVFKRLSKKIWKKAKAVIANSQGLRELALKCSFRQRISVIPNGVDVQEFRPLKNKKQNKELILISTGRLIERKGYQYLIPALRGISEVKLQLIGDGPLKFELKELVRLNRVNVEFLGKKNHKEIVEYLQKADIFVLPSLNEGMSNSILEAMSCGLPIITTDVGGSKELIGENGFVIEKRNSEELRKELKNTINKFIFSFQLMKLMGNKSRKLAEEMSWEKVANNYAQGHRRLLGVGDGN